MAWKGSVPCCICVTFYHLCLRYQHHLVIALPGPLCRIYVHAVCFVFRPHDLPYLSPSLSWSHYSSCLSVQLSVSLFRSLSISPIAFFDHFIIINPISSLPHPINTFQHSYLFSVLVTSPHSSFHSRILFIDLCLYAFYIFFQSFPCSLLHYITFFFLTYR